MLLWIPNSDTPLASNVPGGRTGGLITDAAIVDHERNGSLSAGADDRFSPRRPGGPQTGAPELDLQQGSVTGAAAMESRSRRYSVGVAPK